jgi:hypothetical protein
MAKTKAVIQESQEQTITFNEKPYVISSLPKELQELIQIHQQWSNDQIKAKLEVFKLDAALRGLISEMETRFSALETPAE